MNVIQRMIFTRNKEESTVNHHSICLKMPRDLFKVKSGLKSGTIDLSKLSLDNLNDSKSTFGPYA